jgi:hypothetical protein
MNDVIASYVDEFNLQLARKLGNDVVFEFTVVRNVECVRIKNRSLFRTHHVHSPSLAYERREQEQSIIYAIA